MALSIEKDTIFETASIPLFSGSDAEWKDNTWIVEHLRQLADYIERESPKIYKVSIETDMGYKIPSLNLKSFKK